MSTRLIEPIEIFIVERLTQTINQQAAALAEVQRRVKGGESACYSPELKRVLRLAETQELLLKLYERLGQVGDSLHALERLERTDEDDELPF